MSILVGDLHGIKITPVQFDRNIQLARELETILIQDCRQEFEAAVKDHSDISFHSNVFSEAPAPHTVSDARQLLADDQAKTMMAIECIVNNQFSGLEVNFTTPISFYCLSSTMGDRIVCKLSVESVQIHEGFSPLCLISLAWDYGDKGHGVTRIMWESPTSATIAYGVPVYHCGKVCSKYSFYCQESYKVDEGQYIFSKATRSTAPQDFKSGFDERLSFGSVDLRDTPLFNAVANFGEIRGFDASVSAEDLHSQIVTAEQQRKKLQDQFCGEHTLIDSFLTTPLDRPDISIDCVTTPGKDPYYYEIFKKQKRIKDGTLVSMDYVYFPYPHTTALVFIHEKPRKPKKFSFPPTLTPQIVQKLILEEFKRFLLAIKEK